MTEPRPLTIPVILGTGPQGSRERARGAAARGVTQPPCRGAQPGSRHRLVCPCPIDDAGEAIKNEAFSTRRSARRTAS